MIQETKKYWFNPSRRSNRIIKPKKMKIEIRDKEKNAYEIHFGYNILDYIANKIVNLKISRHYVIVTDDHVYTLYGRKLSACFRRHNVTADFIVFPSGERSKSIKTLLIVVEKLLKLGVDRKSALIALGGGVVGDLTGYIASIFMRGISWIQIPTTLLAQVDSSIGGKTAINLQQGKNLLGTFYQPKAVFIDVRYLETLSKLEYRNGLAEIVKYGIIDSEKLFQKLENGVDLIMSKNRPFMEEIIQIACRIKKSIVELDEKEKGRRRILNFGHTLGHAIEQASQYRVSHGNAISIGMIAAARMSKKVYGLSNVELARIIGLISTIGLACRIPESIKTLEILVAIRRDKKKEEDKINYVMIKNIGSPIINGNISDDLLIEAIEEMKV